jgi:hypothetical protein
MGSRSYLYITGQAVSAISHSCDHTRAQNVLFDLSTQSADMVVNRPVHRPGRASGAHFQKFISCENGPGAFK